MDSSNEFNELIGHKIRFRTPNGRYEGIVKSVSLKRKRVTVDHVLSFPECAYMGTLHYFFYEFQTYSIIDSSRKNSKVNKNTFLSTSSENYLCSNALLSKVDRKLKSEKSSVYVDPNLKEEFSLKLPPNLQESLPYDSVILDAFDREFKMATKFISKQSVIGVSFEGSNIGRYGKPVWICISTDYCVFLFDINALGSDLFNNGLRSIFQDLNIVKIIHDCRRPSNCLFHQFSTTLVNVFDTLVADFIVNKQRFTDVSNFKKVSSLDSCLVNYLAVPEDFLYKRKNDLSYLDEVRLLYKRPLDNECRNTIIKNALYLKLLKEKLSKLMMTPLYEASNMYLSVLSESSESDLTVEPSVPCMIPQALLAKGITVVRLQKDSVETSNTPKLKNYSEKENAVENNLPEKGSNKIMPQIFDSNSLGKQKTLPNTNVALECKGKEKTKYSSNVDSEQANTSADDFVPKCSAVRTKFRNKTDTISCSRKCGNIVNETSGKLISNANELRLKRTERPVLKNEFHAESDVTSRTDLSNEATGLNESSSNINNSFPDYSDIWAKLRLAFGVTADGSNKSINDSKKKTYIVPSGMGC